MDKFKILTLNNIAARGLERLPMEAYEVGSEFTSPDGIILRSANIHEMAVPESLLAIGRAGAGVNNIPVDKMSRLGIPVFNAPGANANAVKELVISAMLIGCRNICHAWDYVRGLEGDKDTVNSAVEKGKKQFAGFELPGKTLGVVGLGAIGVQVANAARALGMNVIGYDPTITVARAWELSSDVYAAQSLAELYAKADFLTFHVPLIDSTRDLVNVDRIAQMKENVVIINFARQGVVNDAAVLEGLNAGKVYAYLSDFPTAELIAHPRVVALPHLGASTSEAEENCAIMVANQLRDYLEHGIIRNSVNFPEITLQRSGQSRLVIANENQPDMLGQISHALGKSGLNISHMQNESRGDIAYTVVDIDQALDASCCAELRDIPGVLKVRAI
ncbi:MAG TPA: 3-phosphoglycerate dehydrogenase [Gammaproteobacteria bacterium]|jgi:D-3-phosphoglycerate dehydrogenase|nr:3-phosphoglycerate dehydrogenase [Gammaproteobacteria bacterium]